MSKMKKVVFVADFFQEDLAGGAERADQVLIEHLRTKYDVQCTHSHLVELSDVRSWKDENSIVILGNFTNLKDLPKRALEQCHYIIYEHDHKYNVNRDPSIYMDFRVPPSQLCNESLYKNAQCVVCLSEIHKHVVELNVKGVNAVSIGTSLWSQSFFDEIRKLEYERRSQRVKGDVKNSQSDNYALIKWKNPIKGYHQAKKWLRSNQIEFEEIERQEHYALLKELAGYDVLVFFPQVLETFSRICCEAKMLGLKLGTIPGKLGFASETVYKLNGEALIDEMEKRVQGALETFEECVNSCIVQGANEEWEKNVLKKDEDGEVQMPAGDITTILTVYRRPLLLKEQLEAISNQSLKSKNVWVWVNAHEDNEEHREYIEGLCEDYNCKLFWNNENWSYFGRFAVAQLARTEFIALFDDDTLPGVHWFEHCMQTFAVVDDEYPVLGTVGCILPERGYYGHKRVGWSNPNALTTEVDLVGHAWFFHKENVRAFWREELKSWETGEDIHLSAMTFKYLDSATYVPSHSLDHRESWGSLKGMEYGVDDVASSHPSNHKQFYKSRDQLVEEHKEGGWVVLRDFE